MAESRLQRQRQMLTGRLQHFAAHGVRDRAAAGTSAIQTCTAPMLRTKGERADSIRLVETASAPGSFR